MKKYENLPINAAKAGVAIIVQIPGYATGIGMTLEEATQQAVSQYLTAFFDECYAETKEDATKP